MSPESAPLTGMARASLVSRRVLILRDYRRQSRLQIGQTRFPIGAALLASPSKTPLLSRPDGLCDAPRRTDPAASACARIARLGRRRAPSPDAIRFDQAARERLACRSAE